METDRGLRKKEVPGGIYQSMEPHTKDVAKLVAVQTVRCLECGETYSKPEGGGTVNENPGCPKCTYLGWISASIPVTHRGHARLRSGEGRLPHPAVRAH